jgi:hypothetical protein
MNCISSFSSRLISGTLGGLGMIMGAPREPSTGARPDLFLAGVQKSEFLDGRLAVREHRQSGVMVRATFHFVAITVFPCLQPMNATSLPHSLGIAPLCTMNPGFRAGSLCRGAISGVAGGHHLVPGGAVGGARLAGESRGQQVAFLRRPSRAG